MIIGGDLSQPSPRPPGETAQRVSSVLVLQTLGHSENLVQYPGGEANLKPTDMPPAGSWPAINI